MLLLLIISSNSIANDNVHLDFNLCVDGDHKCNDRILFIQSLEFDHLFDNLILRRLITKIDSSNYSLKSFYINIPNHGNYQSDIREAIRQKIELFNKYDIIILSGDSIIENINFDNISEDKQLILISEEEHDINYDNYELIKINYNIRKLLDFFKYVNFSPDKYYIFSDKTAPSKIFRSEIKISLINNGIIHASIIENTIINMTMLRKEVGEIDDLFESSCIINTTFTLFDFGKQGQASTEAIQKILEQHNNNQITIGIGVKHPNESIIILPDLNDIADNIVNIIKDKELVPIKMTIILNIDKLKDIGKKFIYTKGIYEADWVLLN